MEKVEWKVDGMDCSNCALTIRKYLEKKGMQDVKVNFATGDVSFAINGIHQPQELAVGIKDLGYEVENQQPATSNPQRFLTTRTWWVRSRSTSKISTNSTSRPSTFTSTAVH